MTEFTSQPERLRPLRQFAEIAALVALVFVRDAHLSPQCAVLEHEFIAAGQRFDAFTQQLANIGASFDVRAPLARPQPQPRTTAMLAVHAYDQAVAAFWHRHQLALAGQQYRCQFSSFLPTEGVWLRENYDSPLPSPSPNVSF